MWLDIPCQNHLCHDVSTYRDIHNISWQPYIVHSKHQSCRTKQNIVLFPYPVLQGDCGLGTRLYGVMPDGDCREFSQLVLQYKHGSIVGVKKPTQHLGKKSLSNFWWYMQDTSL